MTFADALTIDGQDSGGFRKGTVTAVSPLTVQLGGGGVAIASVAQLSGYNPIIGDVVWCRVEGGSVIVVDAIGSYRSPGGGAVGGNFIGPWVKPATTYPKFTTCLQGGYMWYALRATSAGPYVSTDAGLATQANWRLYTSDAAWDTNGDLIFKNTGAGNAYAVLTSTTLSDYDGLTIEVEYDQTDASAYFGMGFLSTTADINNTVNWYTTGMQLDAYAVTNYQLASQTSSYTAGGSSWGVGVNRRWANRFDRSGTTLTNTMTGSAGSTFWTGKTLTAPVWGSTSCYLWLTGTGPLTTANIRIHSVALTGLSLTGDWAPLIATV